MGYFVSLFVPVKQDKGIFNVFAKVDSSSVSETDILDKGADDGSISEGVDLSIGEGVDLSNGEDVDLIGESVDLSIDELGIDEGVD